MGNVSRGSAGAAGGRFAHVADAFSRMGSDELVSVFSEGDGYATHVLVEDVELAYECANGATFEGAVFRSCLFEQVDLRDCTFRDVVFEGCRFIGCAMDRSWLNRVDMRDCSAPGMSLLRARLAQVSALSTDLSFEGCRFIGCAMDRSWLNRVDMRDCSAPGMSLLRARLAQVSALSTDLSYANLSETSIDRLLLRDCKLREAALQRAKLKRVQWDACDLTRIDVFGTPLAGIDVSGCVFTAPVLSGDFRELRGAVVSPEQALDVAQLLRVRIAEE